MVLLRYLILIIMVIVATKSKKVWSVKKIILIFLLASFIAGLFLNTISFNLNLYSIVRCFISSIVDSVVFGGSTLLIRGIKKSKNNEKIKNEEIISSVLD